MRDLTEDELKNLEEKIDLNEIINKAKEYFEAKKEEDRVIGKKMSKELDEFLK